MTNSASHIEPAAGSEKILKLGDTSFGMSKLGELCGNISLNLGVGLVR